MRAEAHRAAPERERATVGVPERRVVAGRARDVPFAGLRDHNDGSLPELDARLVDLMARMQRTLETSEPLQIVSGYRSPTTNARARRRDGRVARNSLHMHGQAVDIRVRGHSLSQLRRAALSLQAGGVGTYPNRDFLHIDVGRVRSWG